MSDWRDARLECNVATVTDSSSGLDGTILIEHKGNLVAPVQTGISSVYGTYSIYRHHFALCA